MSRRGFALISTLVMLTAITSVASVSTIRSVSDAAFHKAIESERRDRIALESALNAGIFHLLDQGREESRTFRSKRRMTWEHDGRTIELILEHETGKIDLNVGDLQLIERAVAELFPNHVETIISRVRTTRAEQRLFWRVADLLPPIEQMGPLEAVTRSHFTIYSSASGVSLMTAAAAVVRAIPGMSAQEAQRILDAQRTGAWSADIGAGLDGKYFTIEQPLYRLRARFRETAIRDADRSAVVTIDARYGTWRMLAN